MITIEYDPQRTNTVALAASLRSAGFRAGGAQTRIGIADLHCASCVRFIEDGLKATPGVLDATVNVGTQEATIDYLPEKTSLPNCAAPSKKWAIRPVRPPATNQRTSKRRSTNANIAA